MSIPSIPCGPGLFEITDDDGDRAVTNIRKIAGGDVPAGRALVNTAAILLGILDLGLFAVSLAAQYQYILHAKHKTWPASIEAVALDAGMIIFSLLALGLARSGQKAPVERALILACAAGSAAMNYAAADVSSVRSVAAYVMPPVFLAIVTDRVVAVVRRHMLGMEAERSAWAALGRAAIVTAAFAGKAVLYGLRLILAPRSTFGGARRLVLLVTPLPGVAAVALALDPVRAALDENLRELRERHEITAGNLDGDLRAVQQSFRTETEAVRETLRTEIEAMRETLRTQAPAVTLTALDEDLRELRTVLDKDLRELRERHEITAGNLDGDLRAVQQSFRTETEAVRETLRTEIEAMRETLRTQAPAPGQDDPVEVDRDALVAELADQIRDAIRAGDRWTPDYDELIARTGYRRRWCEKAVQDARTQIFAEPDLDRAGESTTGVRNPSPANPEENQ